MKSDTAPLYALTDGTIYDYPGRTPLFRTGNSTVQVDNHELIPLPEGSYLFSMVERYPLYLSSEENAAMPLVCDDKGRETWAVSSFLASGYLRTYLPAYKKKEGAPHLPLWAYAGVVMIDDEFYVPAMRIDEDVRSDPAIHQNHDELDSAISEMVAQYPENRLVRQLTRCSTEYNCLCARNFFLERYEAPVPTTPACNARCLGCLSHQPEGSGFAPSQYRLEIQPTPAEICEVIYHHISSVPRSVASFGQGCEGEPLLRAADLAEGVRMVREKTGRGTININTNGSIPDNVQLLIDAGIDSIRISMNSPSEEYYTAYHKPVNYTYSDVLASIERALNSGIHVSLNLFFMPGFTDMESEVDALMEFLKRFPVQMIQTRNLNVDPDLYFDTIGFKESKPLGVRTLISLLRQEFPEMLLGYYNPPLRD